MANALNLPVNDTPVSILIHNLLLNLFINYQIHKLALGFQINNFSMLLLHFKKELKN